MPENLEDLTKLSREMAAAAGALALTQRSQALHDVDTKSSTVDIVTAADRAGEQLIRDRLLATRPHDAIVGEEGAAKAGTSGLTWFLDPIDGTTNFYYGLPGWVVSIAVSDSEGIAVGAVFDPVADLMYSAYRGGGAQRNGKPITARQQVTPLSSALVATGFSYQAHQRKRQAQILVELIPQVRDIRRLGSAAKDLCLVAEGSCDAYFEAGLNQWDLAAGWIIAAEAGAKVAFLTPESHERRLLLAATASVFDPLEAALEAAGAPLDP
ncbi:MAG: inositol monophosphatase [Acidimicrobiales bacterium]|nr:inositol monophosphatase [Acidimicrobiales bacterium]